KRKAMSPSSELTVFHCHRTDIPVTRVVVPLVSAAYRDAVPGEHPQFFDEPVVQLLAHLRERKAMISFRPLMNSDRFLRRESIRFQHGARPRWWASRPSGDLRALRARPRVCRGQL